MSLTDLPADDELEVTLFGRGVGECVVLHVGQGVWVIVDSFVSEFELPNPDTDRPQRVPVARWYLEGMGVARDRVSKIVVTHLHQDHYRGVDRLHDHYTEAQLFVTAALTDDAVRLAYSDTAAQRLFGCMPDTMKRARLRKCSSQYPNGLRTLSVNTGFDCPDGGRLTALSPMDAALDASRAEMAEWISAGRQALRSELRGAKQNRCSVVLHLRTPAGTALLCADLEVEPREFGWAAVLDEADHKNLSRAHIVKVAHHGSHTGDSEEMWDRLVERGADMIVAPYTSGRYRLPTEEDWRRLAPRGPLHQAAPSTKFVRNSVGYPTAREGPTGVVRARRKVGDDRWTIRYAGTAFHVNPLVV
jgi:beta-lactamase superfamily II metal-dependent hydrolase